ncbi:MAG: prolyl oligopeptidase family serine peptidase [Acidimicrobiales bacterium]
MPVPRCSAAMVAAGRVVGEPRLSPDAALVAFVAVTAGRAALVVVPATGGAEVVVSTEPAPIGVRVTSGAAFDWAPDGGALVYAAVDGGLWRQPVVGGPATRVVAPLAEGPAAAPAVSPDGTRVAFVVDSRTVCVAGLDAAGPAPWPQPLSTGCDFAVDPCWSPDGTSVAWHEWDAPAMAWDASRIVVRAADARTPARVVAGGGGVSLDGAVAPDAVAVAQPRFAADGRLGLLSDEGGWQHLRVLGPDLDPAAVAVVGADGSLGELGDPTWGPGIRTWTFSPSGHQVALRTNVDGFAEVLVVDPERPEAVRRTVARGVHAGLDWRSDRLVAVRTGARTPHQVVAYDLGGAGGRETRPARTTLARGPVAGWEAAGLDEPEVVRWPTDDATVIVGRLYRPAASAGGGEGPPPLLCWVHGGPTDQWPVTFNARFAWFLERGWAILVPDHRGSTGHGRAHQQAMHGRWGELDVDDCAAGVALSAVTDLFDLAERGHRFERHYPATLVGGLPAAAGRYRSRSPLHLAESIRAPVLLLHGSADEVVPVEQAETMATRLRDLGRVVDLHVYRDEGHGWGRPDVVVDELDRVHAFLRRWVLVRRPPGDAEPSDGGS